MIDDDGAELVRRVAASSGLDLVPDRELPTRVGRSFVVSDERGGLLLKSVVAADGDEKSRRRAAGLQNEASVLRELDDYFSGRYVADGTTGQLVWAMQRWIEGTASTSATAGIRDRPTERGARRLFVADCAAMAMLVAGLHERGWLHGDIQPDHFLRGHRGWHLLDLETAARRDATESTYAGALVHFVTPETAEAVFAGRADIAIDVRSDVYSVGAVLWFLYTGVRPVWYGRSPEDIDDGAAPFAQKLAAVTAGRRRTFADVGSPDFAEFEELLDDAMAADPRDRLGSGQQFVERLEALRIR